LVSSFSCVEYVSKNSILIFSKFSGGIGFSILVGVIFLGSRGLAISVFLGYVQSDWVVV
jgi:hypothetical protein